MILSLSTRHLIFACLFTALATQQARVQAQEPVPDKFDPVIAHWLKVACPSKEDKESRQRFFRRANMAEVEWTVKVHAGQVQAALVDFRELQPASERPAFADELTLAMSPDGLVQLRFMRVEDGWLVSRNHGEFGGKVVWVSPEGKEQRQVSDSHRVNQFITLGSRVFAVEGLAHMGGDAGSVIELTKEQGRWKAATFVKLPSTGYAATQLSGEELLVAASEQLVSVSLDTQKMIKVIAAEGGWGGLYPGSVVMDPGGDCAWIGMRQYVVRVDLRRKDLAPEYFVPSAEFINTLRPF